MSENNSTEDVRSVNGIMTLDDKTIFTKEQLFEQIGFSEESWKKVRENGLRKLRTYTNKNWYLGSHVLQALLPEEDMKG